MIIAGNVRVAARGAPSRIGARAPTDDIVWHRASRGPSLQCMPLWGCLRVELSARWLRSCRIVARQNTSAFLPKWGAWPHMAARRLGGGSPPSWSYARDRNGAPPNPSGWCTTGAADCGRQAIGAPSISSVTRGLRRWRHVKSIRSYQIRSFKVMLACVMTRGSSGFSAASPLRRIGSVSSSAPSWATLEQHPQRH